MTGGGRRSKMNEPKETGGKRGGGSIWRLLVVIIALVGLGIALKAFTDALADSSWGTFTIAVTIPIVLIAGLFLYRWNNRMPHRIKIASRGFAGLAALAAIGVLHGWLIEKATTYHRTGSPFRLSLQDHWAQNPHPGPYWFTPPILALYVLVAWACWKWIESATKAPKHLADPRDSAANRVAQERRGTVNLPAGGPPPPRTELAPLQRTIIRTGKSKTGRPINYYSDGSVEYAD